MIDAPTQIVLKMDLKHLTPEDLVILHDLKCRAAKRALIEQAKILWAKS